MFNQNNTQFLMLTEGMFRVYDSLNYSVLYTNGNDNRCSESPQMALSQNGAKAVFYAPCQSKEMIEVNLQTWESSTYAQTLSSFIDTYSQDGDYYYVGNIWTGGLFLKPDGASIRSPLGFVDSTTIWMKQDNSVIQTISLPHETAVAVETVGDQSSILFARTDEQTYSAYPNSDYSVLIYNSSAGTSKTLPSLGEIKLNSASISKDGSRVIIIYNDEEVKIYERDRDSDGFSDSQDLCPLEQGDYSGCLQEYFDSDADGINDRDDLCPGTTNGLNVDNVGCALSQIDADMDGISDASDQCANTPIGESVGLTGCSNSQVDSDEDGVYDSQDNCPSTPPKLQ